MDEENTVFLHIFMAEVTTVVVALVSFRRKSRAKNMPKKPHGGSRPGRGPNRNNGRKVAGKGLQLCYFLNNSAFNKETGGRSPAFSETGFERRFCMPRAVYSREQAGVLKVGDSFKKGRDCAGNPSATKDQKMAGALRQLSLGISADGLVQMLRTSESLLSECRQKFGAAVCCRFEIKYLRRLTADGARNIVKRHYKLDFPGALGSLDCTGWTLHREPLSKQCLTIEKPGSPEYRLES